MRWLVTCWMLIFWNDTHGLNKVEQNEKIFIVVGWGNGYWDVYE